MKSDTPSYHGYRFPPEIISHAVWLYHRFGVSFRDVEDLLAQRGITVSYEAIRLWCLTFGSAYARRLKRRQGRLGDTWHLDEVFVTIQGRRHYLWRAVDQDGDVIDILVQARRDCHRAAQRWRRLTGLRRGHNQPHSGRPGPAGLSRDVRSHLKCANLVDEAHHLVAERNASTGPDLSREEYACFGKHCSWPVPRRWAMTHR